MTTRRIPSNIKLPSTGWQGGVRLAAMGGQHGLMPYAFHSLAQAGLLAGDEGQWHPGEGGA